MEIDQAWQCTGIGSLPYNDPADAVSLVLGTFGDLPHWPQLPARGEGFARQYLRPLLEHGIVSETQGGRVEYRVGDDWPERMASFYDTYLDAVDSDDYRRFAFAPGTAAGFDEFCQRVPGTSATMVKGQTSGPLTVGFTITSPDRKAAWWDPQFRDALTKTLACNARWQAKTLAALGPRALVFVDEPGLFMYGQSTFVAIDRDTVVESLTEVVSAVVAGGALAGVHVCAGCDWSLALLTPITVLSFDAWGYADSLLPYAAEISEFLQRGGRLAWGIVPTSDLVLEQSVSSLAERLQAAIDGLCRRGVDRDLVRARSMLTPSCGAGTLSREVAERVYHLVSELASSLT